MARHTTPSSFIRKFSRRDFMQLSLAAGFTVATADRLWAQEAAERKRGGHFRIGLGQGATTDMLDPATFMDFMPATVCASYANFLTEVDADGNITPDLAESFEGTDGAKTWAFRLRKGVQFHDGRELKPEDVVASIRHHLGPDSKSGVKAQLSAIKEIKADGGNVVFSLEAGNADLPYLLSDYHLPIFPAREDGGMDWQARVGTGPYMLDAWQPGIGAKLKRNPNYYRETWFDEVEILSIVDVAARMNALVTGDIHFADRCDLKTLDLLKRNPNIEIDEVTGFAHATFSMDVTQAPFDNPDVRNALKHAVDREAILNKIFFGHGIAGNDNPIAPSVKYATSPEPRHGYDPAKARELLKRAGLEGLKIDLSAADTAFAGAVDAALLFKESAAAAGIDINVIREPNDAYWETVWGKKPFIASYFSGRPVQDLQFSLAYAEGAAWNETKWANKHFNELLTSARIELDEAKRAALYAEMQQLVHDDGGTIVLLFVNYVSAHSKSVAHGKLATDKEIDGTKIASRWWMTA